MHLLNGVMIARRQSPVMQMLLKRACGNVVKQWSAERLANAYVPYNVYVLTGAGLFSCLIELRGGRPEVAACYAEVVWRQRLATDPMPQPFTLYKFYGYRKPGNHWSERQNHERLFLQRLALTPRKPGAPELTRSHGIGVPANAGRLTLASHDTTVAIPSVIDLTIETAWMQFTKGGICGPELGAGGVWTEGRLARFYFTLEHSGYSKIRLAIELLPFVVVESLPEQIVYVRVNGTVVAKWKLRKPIWQRRSVSIALEKPSSPSDLAIDLVIPTAAAPSALAVGPDHRRLGVLMRRLHWIGEPGLRGARRPRPASAELQSARPAG